MTQSAPQFRYPGLSFPKPNGPAVDFRTELRRLDSKHGQHTLWQRRCKRLFDVAGGLALSLFFAPLFGIIYLLVRMDGGPGFFGHERIGENGASFKCWKFRTMVVNADVVLAELLARDREAAAEWRRDFKLRRDPRITPLGRVLRLVSLDELPQLWNVVKGEMSLVGPRPIVREEMNRYGAHIFSYLSCRPGLTGLWQVSGRSDLTYAERVALDTIYASQWSLRGDAVILLRTIGVMVNRDGAY